MPNTAIETRKPQHIRIQEPMDWSGWTYRPDVDVIDDDDSFQIVADVPGALQDHINVTFDESVLTIEARVARRQPARSEFQRQEFGVGNYFRRFHVGEGVDPEKIGASYRDGVLMVTLPKTAGSVRRRVPVNAG